MAAYDTLNEPGEKAGTTSSKHWAFYNQMYKTIRSVDPDHIIIMESCWGTANLPKPSDYGWSNVMYEYHHYTRQDGITHHGHIKQIIRAHGEFIRKRQRRR